MQPPKRTAELWHGHRRLDASSPYWALLSAEAVLDQPWMSVLVHSSNWRLQGCHSSGSMPKPLSCMGPGDWKIDLHEPAVIIENRIVNNHYPLVTNFVNVSNCLSIRGTPPNPLKMMKMFISRGKFNHGEWGVVHEYRGGFDRVVTRRSAIHQIALGKGSLAVQLGSSLGGGHISRKLPKNHPTYGFVHVNGAYSPSNNCYYQ